MQSNLPRGRFDPILHGLGNELGAVIGANERRHAAQDEQVTQDIDYGARVQLPVDTDGQAFAAEVVDDVERAERLSIVRPAMHKVV